MNKRTSAQSETIELGNAGGDVSNRLFLQVVGSGWTGTLSVEGRLSRSDMDFIELPVRPLGADSAFGDISGSGIYEVDATGLDVRLVHLRTAGSVTFAWHNVVG